MALVNPMKAKLAAGKATVGTWCNIPSPAVARLAAGSIPLDWVLIDGEHCPMSAPLMMEMIHAVASCGVSPIVRIPNHDVSWVKWSLDAGAHGIMIPMVNTREQMETIISHSKYPPFGQRSSGATWSKFGWPASGGASSYAGGAEYASGADREILIIPQIETKMAVENVDAILSVKGVDMAFVGPFDLHLSLGLAPSGEGAEPEFVAAIEKVLASCKKNGVAAGIFTTSGAAAKMRIEQGFQFVNPSNSVGALIGGMAAEAKACSG